MNGFRNRDLRAALYPKANDPAERRRQASRATRALALLRAHGLIRKVSRTHRYMLTRRGREAITALPAARKAPVDQLLKLAA